MKMYKKYESKEKEKKSLKKVISITVVLVYL